MLSANPALAPAPAPANEDSDDDNVDLSWWNHSNTYIVTFVIVVMLLAILYLLGYTLKIEIGRQPMPFVNKNIPVD